jgi:hypothetical protein
MCLAEIRRLIYINYRLNYSVSNLYIILKYIVFFDGKRITENYYDARSEERCRREIFLVI